MSGPVQDATARAQRLPPVGGVAMATLATVIAGGIYLASHLPRPAPLGPAVASVAAAAILLAINIVSLARLRSFAWGSFFLVGKWALAAYLVVAGMLEYVFILDQTRGATLVLLTLMLAIFGLTVPLVLAFAVARYQPVDGPEDVMGAT